MSVRLAVVGAGVMGADHAKIVAGELPGAVLQIVCDSDRSRAKAVGEACGAVDIAYDPEAVIARADVDALILASPDVTHAPLAKACIAGGKKVMCEKPLSQASSDCIEIMAAERKRGANFVQVGFMRRFDRAYIEMKQALSEGRLGRALMMHNFHRNLETPNVDFTGAMAITNSAPHEFDVARHVLGVDYVSIAVFQPARSDGVVAPVVMVLETSDRQLVTVEINNNAAYGYDIRAELVGEAGSMTMNPVAYTRTDMQLACSTRYDLDWRDRYGEAYRRQNQAFLKFVETDDFSLIAANAWDGYCAAIVAEAGVKALCQGSKVPVETIAKPHHYA